MWARLDNENFVAELMNIDPTGLFHPDLIFVPIPDWFVPYINKEYWYANEVFEDATGYEKLLASVKTKQTEEFEKIFQVIDNKKIRSISEQMEQVLKNSAADAENMQHLEGLNALTRLNRIEQDKIENIALPESCTFEQAKEKIMAVKAIVPINIYNQLTIG